MLHKEYSSRDERSCLSSFVRLIAVVFPLIVPVCASADVINSDAFARLKREAPAAWEAQAKLTSNIDIRGSVHKVMRHLSGDAPITRDFTQEFEYAADRDKSIRLFQMHGTNTNVTNRQLVNPRYRFSTSDVGTGGAWVLNNAKNATGNDLWSHGTTEADVLSYLTSGYTVIGVPLEEMISGNDFVLLALDYLPADESNGNSESVIHIESRYNGEKRPFHRVDATYWADVRADTGWLLSRCGIHNTAKRREETQEVAYQTLANGQRFPATCNWIYVDPTGDYQHVYDVKLSEPKPNQRPSTEYYLENYNLPTAVLETGRSSGTAWLFAINIGAGALLLIYYFVARKKRPGERPKVVEGAV